MSVISIQTVPLFYKSVYLLAAKRILIRLQAFFDDNLPSCSVSCFVSRWLVNSKVDCVGTNTVWVG